MRSLINITVHGKQSPSPSQGAGKPAVLIAVRREPVQRGGIRGFGDRGVRRRSRYYVEHSDRAKDAQGVPLGRRSRRVVRNAGSGEGE